MLRPDGPFLELFQLREFPPPGVTVLEAMQQPLPLELLPYLISFLCGSIPFAWLVGKSRGIDLLQVGSRNPGATNLAREAGKGFGAVGLFFDLLKGAAPVLWFGSAMNHPQLFLVGAAAVVGHCFSPFLKGRGGKGVATLVGVLLAMEPWIALMLLVCWLIGLKVVGSVGISSVVGAVTGLLLSLGLMVGWEPALSLLWREVSPAEAATFGAILMGMSVLVALRHRSNIQEYLKIRREGSR